MKHKSSERPTDGSSTSLKRTRTYDRDLLNESLYEVLDYYAPGEARTVGTRTTYTCPECHRPKLDASSVHMKAGCWTAGCSVPKFTNACGFVAHFESLDPASQFREILEKGYEIVGLDPDSSTKRISTTSSEPSSIPTAAPAWQTVAPPDARKASSRNSVSGGRPPEDLERLRGAVYLRIMDFCRLEDRDRDFFRSRGLTDESIRRGVFGSISYARAQALKATLLDEYVAEDLLQVPGFSVKGTGELKFTLTGDYALIPYHDSAGRITTMEGRWTGDGPPPGDMGKYVSLLGAGNHLYVFPGCSTGEMEAFCEGSVGAMVAAQSGITVGAIQGFRRYRSSSVSSHDGEYGGPLAELRGVDFSGRLVPYIPDVDDPPQPEVSQAAPVAARWLVERQGGLAALLHLPEGKDLDEWLLGYDPSDRRKRFDELLRQAIPLVPLVPDPSDDAVNTGGMSESSPKSKSRGDVSGKEGESENSPRTGANLGDDELRDRVYRAYLAGCTLSDGHKKLLTQWKITKETAHRAGLSSVLPGRSEGLRDDLISTFERSLLERVPGFGEDSDGKLTLPFEDHGEELIVFPYKDTAGRITALEGVRPGRDLAAEERYVSPSGEARLYLPPGTEGWEIELLCSGLLSALNLSEAGVRAAALRGMGSLDPSRTNRDVKETREAPSLDLEGKPVGVFEDQDDSASLGTAIESLGGYVVPVKLPEQTGDVEWWIVSLSGNKERSQRLGRLVESVRNAPVRVPQTSSPEANQTDQTAEISGSPPTAKTRGLQQGILFHADSATSSQPAHPNDQDAGSTNSVQIGAGTSGSSQGDVSSDQEEAAETEARRIEKLPALHGEGWLEVCFEDIPKIAARDRLRAENEDGNTCGGIEKDGQEEQSLHPPARPHLSKSDLHLGAIMGILCLLVGALVCVSFLYALNWPLALAGSALACLSLGVAAGLLFGVGTTLGASERRVGGSAYYPASDAWTRSWSQAAFAFLATYLILTLFHHTAHLVVYPLAGGGGQGQGADFLFSVWIFFARLLDGIVPASAVLVAPLVSLIAAIVVFLRVWEVRKRGPAHTVVEVAGGSYTLPSTNLITFWEGVAAAMAFAVIGRASYFLLTVFAGRFEDGVGGGVVQTLVDGKLALVSCLFGVGAAVYGWLGSNSRRRVEKQHLLGTLNEHK